jgi:molybdopterin-synthase adenylyltransferase
MREGLGIVLVHAHDFSGTARLSRDDMESARRLVPMFRARVPGRPHGSIVLARGTATGFLAMPSRAPALLDDVAVRWMGQAIVDWPSRDPQAGSDDEVFDRQALVLGDHGALSRACVAVVGLCGGGGHVVQQFAHSGIGTVIGIDTDICEITNAHRLVGMRPADAVRRRQKTAVMSRVARSVGTGTKFIGINARVPEPSALMALKRADIIVGCVDTLHARADVQEFAWRHVIPYVDVGVGIRALSGSVAEPRVSIGGNIFVLIPGGFCPRCAGFLSDAALKEELGGRDRSYFQNKKGQAQVISFNGVLASQAVSEVLQFLTGYRGSGFDPSDLALEDGRQRGALKFDGRRGTLEEWGARRREACPCCEGSLGAGTVLWRKAS